VERVTEKKRLCGGLDVKERPVDPVASFNVKQGESSQELIQQGRKRKRGHRRNVVEPFNVREIANESTQGGG